MYCQYHIIKQITMNAFYIFRFEYVCAIYSQKPLLQQGELNVKFENVYCIHCHFISIKQIFNYFRFIFSQFSYFVCRHHVNRHFRCSSCFTKPFIFGSMVLNSLSYLLCALSAYEYIVCSTVNFLFLLLCVFEFLSFILHFQLANFRHIHKQESFLLSEYRAYVYQIVLLFQL